jgi:hypothetical protein
MLRTTNTRARRGAVVILIALVLAGLLGVTAIAVDGGLLQDNRRRVQAGADMAALAAAGQLFANYPEIVLSNYKLADPGGAAEAAAFADAAANGYTNDRVDSAVTVNIPPKSGPFTDMVGWVEVIITYNQPRYFSAIWGTTRVPITCRAVARGRWAASGDGIIVLDPVAKDSLNAGGTGLTSVSGGAHVIVDSNYPVSAARDTGGGGMAAVEFDVTGGATGSFTGTVNTGTLPIPDPLAYLPPPPVPPDGTMTSVPIGQGNKQYTLTPGRFSNLPSFSQGDVVIFEQASYNAVGGIYYIDGGGLKSTGANLIMDPSTTGGIMFYNNPANSSSSQGIGIQGNASGTVNLSPLTSGPYSGILFWQNRMAAQTISISGNGSFSLTGTFYAANAQMSVTGNGTAVIGSQYISRTFTISGGGNVLIDYTPKGTARIRDIRLVE